MNLDPQIIAFATPIVIGLVQIIKQTGLPQKAAPFAAIGIGILVAAGFSSGFSVEAILEGIVAGLSAAGLYDTGKATVAMAVRSRTNC